MKIYDARFTTTHKDKHGEHPTLEELERVVKQANASYIPVGAHHDPRIAPQGRVLEAHIEELDDGEHAASGQIEIFENGDAPEEKSGPRSIPERRPQGRALEVLYDRAFLSPNVERDLTDIARGIGASCNQDLKKAIEPSVPILTIVGITLGLIVARDFFKGFFTQMGEDAWVALRKRIPRLFRTLRKGSEARKECLLVLRAVPQKGNPYLCVEVVVPNATEEDLVKLRTDAASDIDMIVAKLGKLQPSARHFTFEFVDGELKLLYAVRSDAAPLFPDSEAKPEKLIREVRNVVEIDIGMGISLAGTARRMKARDGSPLRN